MQQLKRFVDYTGYRAGKALVIGFNSWHYQPSGQRKSKWDCLCDCGNTFVALGYNLKKSNHTTSCGCQHSLVMKKRWSEYSVEDRDTTDLLGREFGRLTVKAFDGWSKGPSGVHYSNWKCFCVCGGEIVMRRSYLMSTEVPSCGCYRSEKISEARTTHGMTGTPTYLSWLKMRERCYLDTYAEKEYYQDKGVIVCDEWLQSFENFLFDMGERPEGKTLDRIDGTLGYSKENCRWSDLTTQAYNQKRGSNNTSGRTGVYQMSNGSWLASISHYNTYIVLARNVSFEDAVSAREVAEIKYYGWNKE